MIYKDQLEAVYRLIEKPENWTQGAYARDADNNDLCEEEDIRGALSERANCWCIYGAAAKCEIKWSDMDRVFRDEMLHEFNDTHTHAEVLALLQSAINTAPERP